MSENGPKELSGDELWKILSIPIPGERRQRIAREAWDQAYPRYLEQRQNEGFDLAGIPPTAFPRKSRNRI